MRKITLALCLVLAASASRAETSPRGQDFHGSLDLQIPVSVSSGITSSSGTFTQVGAASYGVRISSGLDLATGQLRIGAGGFVLWPDGTTSTTAATGGGGAGTLTGSGTAGKLSKWTSSTALGDSLATETAGGISVSSLTLTASGQNVSALTVSSGVHVQNGVVRLDTGTFISFPDGTTQATAATRTFIVLQSPSAGNFQVLVEDDLTLSVSPTSSSAGPDVILTAPSGQRARLGVEDDATLTTTPVN